MNQNKVKDIIIPAFFEEKKGIMCYRSPSVCPSVRKQFTSISSYTIDARITKPWYPHAYRWWQRIWKFSTSSSFEIIQILVILPKNAISLVIFHEIGSNFLSIWGKVIYIIYQTGFIMWLPDPLRKWKYRWRGADFERKLFVTSVYQHLLLHYWC